MKKTILNFIKTSALILVAALTISGCSNLTDLFTNDSESTENTSGKCAVSFCIDGVARTISPTLTQTDLTYTLYGTLDSGTKQTLLEGKTYAELTAAKVSLKIGSWSFTLDGIKDSAVVMETTNSVTLSETTSTLSFTLKPVTEGTGTVSFSVDYPEGKVSSTTVTVTSYSTDTTVTPTTKDTKTFSSSGITTTKGVSTFTYSNSSLTAGTYLVNIALTHDTSKVYNYYEILNVYRNCTSSKSLVFTEKSWSTTSTYMCTEDNIADVLKIITSGQNYDETNSDSYVLIVQGAVTDFSKFSTAATNVIKDSSKAKSKFIFDFSAASTSLTSITDTFTSCVNVRGVILPTGVSGVTTYTITYKDSKNSSVIGYEKGILSGKTISAPSNPTSNSTKKEYYFAGWYNGLTATGVYSFSDSAITSNVTLYASWAEETTVSASTKTNGGVKLLIDTDCLADYDIDVREIWFMDSDGGWHQANWTSDSTVIAEETFYYPFTTGDYYIWINYYDAKGWKVCHAETKVTGAKVAFSVDVTNSDEISWKVEDHVFSWVTAPTATIDTSLTYTLHYDIRSLNWAWMDKNYATTDNKFEDINFDTVFPNRLIPHQVFVIANYVVSFDGEEYTMDVYTTKPFYINQDTASDGTVTDRDETLLNFESTDNGVIMNWKEGTSDLASYSIDDAMHIYLSNDYGNYEYVLDMAEVHATTKDADGFYNIALPYITPNQYFDVKIQDKNFVDIVQKVGGLVKSTGNNCSICVVNNTAKVLSENTIDADNLKLNLTTAPVLTSDSTISIGDTYMLINLNSTDGWISIYPIEKTFSAYNGTLDICNDIKDDCKNNYNIKSLISGKDIYYGLLLDLVGGSTVSNINHCFVNIGNTTPNVTIGTLTATVTLDPNGGTFVAENTTDPIEKTDVALGTTISSLLPTTNPTKAGYTFGGWAYVSGSDNVLTTASGAISTIGADMTLTAQWTKN